MSGSRPDRQRVQVGFNIENHFEIAAPTGRLDLDFCLSSGQVFRWQKVGQQWIGVDGMNWYEVMENGDRFLVRSNASQEDFRCLFRLDWNADEIERAIVQRAPELQPYMDALRGLRLMRPSDPVETFFCFLCTANNNIKRITQMVRKLSLRGPVLRAVEGGTLNRFPGSQVIASIPETELRSQGFGYRGATIPQIAQQLLDRGGRRWLEQLAEGPYEEAHKELKAMKGLGPKLADCICLFALHFDQAVPVDTHIWQAMCRLYFPQWKDQSLTDKRYEVAAGFFRERLGNLAGWAHQYLFYENVLNWRKRQ